MTIKIIAALATLVACATCTSCSTMTESSATEADFRNSVGSLIKAQTADPATLSNPSTAPVTGVEPDYAGNVVKAMRESVAKPAEVKQPIVIQAGGQ